jgi:hypothetical protein
MGELVELIRMVPADDIRVVAVSEALAPFAWRSLTAVAVCRRGVAAMDEAGAFAGRSGTPGLAEECVDALVELLAGCPWRSRTVVGLSRLLVGALDEWEHQQAWFDIQLGLLLDSAC